MIRKHRSIYFITLLVLALLVSSVAQAFAQEPPVAPDIPADFAGAWPISPTVEGPDGATVDVQGPDENGPDENGPDIVPLNSTLPDTLEKPTVQQAGPQGMRIELGTDQALDAIEAALPAPQTMAAPGNAESASVEIVGGTQASRGEYLWQVLLKRDGSFICGGSLIHPRWVVTAAHCVTARPAYYLGPNRFSVVVGEYNRSVEENVEQTRSVIQVIVHPGYSPSEYENDIALLELATPVTVGTAAKLISLATSPADNALFDPGDASVVTGWGTTTEGGNAATILREVTVPIVSNAECNASYGNITAGMVCAGLTQGGKDSCQGDSGGPLIVQTGSGSWKLAGVVSFGNGCARPGEPGVYTRIPAYASWINQQIAAAGASGAIISPSFESGPGTGWSEYSSNNGENIMGGGLPFNAYDGQYVAWLGGLNDEFGIVYQPLAFGHRARDVSYYYLLDSAESVCGYDVAEAGIAITSASSNGPVLKSVRSTVIDLCNSNEVSAWRKGTISLSGLEGYSQLYIYFAAQTDDSNVSSFIVDMVSRRDYAVPSMSINSMSPTSGMIGTLVSIRGSGYLNTSQVLFGNRAALFQVVSDNQIYARVPYGVVAAKVKVTTAYGSSVTPANFTPTSTSGLTNRMHVPVLKR